VDIQRRTPKFVTFGHSLNFFNTISLILRPGDSGDEQNGSDGGAADQSGQARVPVVKVHDIRVPRPEAGAAKRAAISGRP
jgi:hypothetical protein